MPIHNKLVRDRIPEIISKSGKEMRTKVLSEERYKEELRRKLYEEIAEYQAAQTDEEALEELADVLELLHALARQHGADISEVERVRRQKAEERGAFDDKIYLIEVADD